MSIRDRATVVPGLALSKAEVKTLTAWRSRHGTLILTREPEPGRTLLRLERAVMPMVEVFDRAQCGRLLFQQYRIAQRKATT